MLNYLYWGLLFFFFKQKTAYEMRISDWSSDVCSSDLRGANLSIPSVTISVLGSTQPGMIQNYVRNVMSGSGSDDGLLQRFGMMVWPDMPRTWTEHDREPNSEFRQQA